MGERRMKAGRVWRVAGVCAVWLAVGAVVNVGVAWGMPLFFGEYALPISLDKGSTDLRSWPYGDEQPNVTFRTRQHGIFMDYDWSVARKPRWSLATGVRFGWPLRCLTTWTDADSERPLRVHYAVRSSEPSGIGAPLYNAGERVLGLQPLWPGFAVNTLIYGFACFGAWCGIGWVRARRRKRLGVCTACGYDLRGLAEGAVCPECGSSCGAVIAAAERRELVAQGGAERNPGLPACAASRLGSL